jgi:hypothetical protein
MQHDETPFVIKIAKIVEKDKSSSMINSNSMMDSSMLTTTRLAPRCINNPSPKIQLLNDSLDDETFNKTVSDAVKKFYANLGWD